MTKLADNGYPIHDLLRQRWSPRSFSDKNVEPEKLRSVLEAARWAASSRNAQPWHFIVATKEDVKEYERLLSCLNERNQKWARNAPVLMLSVAQLRDESGGKENRFAFHDVGLAVENLIIQAQVFDLFVHQMGGFDCEKARDEFSIPENFEPVAAMSLGYLGEPDSLPQDIKERELAPRSRRSLKEFVFSGSWGQTSSLVDDS